MKYLLLLIGLFIVIAINSCEEPTPEELCWKCSVIKTVTLTSSEDLSYFIDEGYTEEELSEITETFRICDLTEEELYLMMDGYKMHTSVRAGVAVKLHDRYFYFSHVSYIDRDCNCTFFNK